jgi:hypothetical protein
MVLPILAVFRFFALRAKKRKTKEDKVLLRMMASGPANTANDMRRADGT